MYQNRSSTSFNILSSKHSNTQPVARQTKAQKFFQQTALPKSLKDDMMLSTNNPEIDGRPSKPVPVEIEVPDENNPFYEIGRVTNKIGHLVANYEEQAEQDHYLMLQELDSNYQINNYDPKEILDESKKSVDGLMNKVKVLKDTQVGMLDDLSDWFSREEKSLKDADLTSNVTLDASIPVTTDDLLQVLQSTAGTSQQRVSKAMALHGDIVSHAFFAIHELQRKNNEQENLISDLKRQLSNLSSRKIKRQHSQNRPGSKDSQNRLQEALSRISIQDETIKRLNKRIEQLIGESVLQGRNENSEKDETLYLQKMQEAVANEMKISQQENEINGLNDQLFKLKHDLQSLEADKSFLESQALTFQEKLNLEHTKYDVLQRQYLELVNEKQDEMDGISEESKKKEKSMLQKIVELQDENLKLNDQILKERKDAYQNTEDRIRQMRKEFELRELELKNRKLNESSDESKQQYLEAIQSQHSDELNLMKKNCDETIETLKKKFQEEKDSMEKDFIEKIKSFQQQINNNSADSTNVAKLIDTMQERNDEKIIEIKKFFTDKIDLQRADFQKHLNSLEEEIKRKDIEIIKLLAEIDEYKSASNAMNLSNENENQENENQINLLNKKVSDYEAKIKEISESFENEKENAVEAVKSEYIEFINKANEVEAINKKLAIEIDVLKKQMQKGNDDSSLSDLMSNFAQQTAELTEAKESLEDVKNKLSESENKILELTKENLKLKNRNIPKTYDFIYSELFSLSKPAQTEKPAVIFEVDNQQHFLMKYEIAASIEPRLQEHIKKLKNKPTIDNNSMLFKESNNSISCQFSNPLCEIDLPLEINNQSDSVVSNNENKFSLNSFEILEIESVNHSLSFSFLNHLSIESNISNELFSSKIETSQNNPIKSIQLEFQKMESFSIKSNELPSSKIETSQNNPIQSAQLDFQKMESFYINSNLQSQTINVAVQVGIEKKTEIKQHTVLSHQPPLEIFAVNEAIIRPDQPIILDPSDDLLQGMKISKNEDDKKGNKLLLLMKSGDLIDIPAINDIDSSTGIDAANAVSKIVMQETAEISNKLKLVVSEIQSIDQEPDPVKRVQMQETLGVELDIEKDSLISQMRERITELEQMMNRVAKQPEEIKEDSIEREVQITNNESSNIALNSNSTQTEMIELENVGVTPTDFSTPDDIEENKTKKNKIEMSEIFTITNEPEKETNNVELGISYPSQTFDIDQKTVDLSTEFGVQYFNISPYSQRSQAEEGDKSAINLQISGKIECDYGYNQSFTQTRANEQFSVIPSKPNISENTKTEARGTSPLNPIVYVDASVSHSTGQTEKQIVQKNNEKVRSSVKIDTAKTMVKVNNNINSLKLVTRNILNIKPVSLKGDFRIAQIQQQAEQISELKKHILRLQLSSSDNMGNVLSSVNSTMSLINDNIKSIQSTTSSSGGGIIIKQKENSDNFMANRNTNVESTARNLREAIEDSANIIDIVAKDDNHLLSTQNDIFMRINESANAFLREMGKPGGAAAECQSRFLRQINEIASDFSDSLSIIQSTIKNDENVKASLLKAFEEVEKQEKFIESLHKQVLDLKLGTGKSHIAQQLADIKDELENIINGKSESNRLIKNIKEAQKIIPKVANRGRNDNIVRQAGASLILERIANLSKNPNSDETNEDENESDDDNENIDETQNDWKNILSLLNEAVIMIDEHDAKIKARKIIDELNCEIKSLRSEVAKLQTDLVTASRDLQIAESKYDSHVRSLQRSLDNSNDHAVMLEKQLESTKEMMKKTDKESRIRALENQIDVMNLADKKRLEALNETNKKNAELVRENHHLSEELTRVREMYSSLFNHCTDTQTINDALKSKTEEIFKEAEIARQKAAALEKMRQSAVAQADDLAHQLTALVTENAQLQSMIVKAQQKERELENMLVDERLKNKSETTPINNNFVDDHVLNEASSNDGQNEKIMKAYQKRIEDCMNSLARNGNDIVDLRARHATDQKEIIMIQREMRRNQNDQKINQLRYESSKKENGLLQKAIANRDETIRSLKREIERLRSLLKVQGPLKHKIQLFEKEKNKAESDFLMAKSKIEETEYQLKKFSSENNKHATSYFDELLQRQRATLARIDKRRNEIREIEEKKKLETLRAVSQVVNMEELQIPEEVILNLMPKPDPVKRLQQRNQILEARKKQSQEEEQNVQNDINIFTKSAPVKNPTEFDTLNSYSSSFKTRQETLLQSSNYSNNLNENANSKYVKQPSYADTLQIIGSLVGQKSPRTLHEMLRNSRQSRIVMPVQPAPFHKKNDTKSVLTIKPMRK